MAIPSAVAAAPWVLALVRERPRLLLAAAIALGTLPFALPAEHTILRFSLLIVCWVIVLNVVLYLVGDARPESYGDFVQHLIVLAVMDWQRTRRADHLGALRSISLGIGQLALFGLIVLSMRQLAIRHAVLMVLGLEILLYLALAGSTNIAVSTLRLRGIHYRKPFRSPLLSRTPAEFWEHRWNTWASHMLHRLVFLPSGGRKHPVRGAFLAFTASGLLHDALVMGATLRFSGWMTAFFLIQAAAVIVTSRWAAFRHLVREAPLVAWVLNLSFLLLSGWMFIAAMQSVLGVDLSGH